MKKIVNHIFNLKAICVAVVLAGSMSSCSDYLNRSPESEYLNTDFYNNEGAIKQGTTACYQRLKMDHTNSSSSNIPYSILWDMYTPFGIERADNTSIGVGNITLEVNFTNEFLWATLFESVARCNALLDGVKPHLAILNDQSLTYIAEVKVLRAHYISQLVCMYGDVPFFMSSVTDEQLKFVERTPWRTIIDELIKDLDIAADDLPWSQSNWGRVDKAVALGLKSRLALYAGSWSKFGYGRDGVKDDEASKRYFELAAAAAKKVIDEGGRQLAPNYNDLFTRSGQMTGGAKSENMFFMMFSDQGVKSTHYMSLGEQVRQIGQSGRFPTQQLVDTYETINGLRIDKDPAYNPKKPFENRDPRLKASIYTHGDTIIGNTGSSKLKFLMNVYGPKLTAWDEKGNKTEVENKDYSGSVAPYGYVQSGVGFAWKKYNHYDDEASALPTYNIVLMRYAEVLLNYAEAKIELNEIDAIVADAINKVRNRVGMPAIGIESQDIMRQKVRRERKVEFAKEMLFLFDMRRWRTGDLQNAEPTYGYPLAIGVTATNHPNGYDQVTPDMVPNFGPAGSAQDLNDVPHYAAYAAKLRVRDKNRAWDNKFYLWPIPQNERNKCPWLTQNDGYTL